jgi:hypothetical protein
MTEVLSERALADLQRSLVEAVLLGRPLPGAGRALAFPDRAFFEERPTVTLLDEHLAPDLSLDDLPVPVRVLSREELLDEARREGDLPYLRFSAPEKVDDAVRLGLEATIATAEPGRRVLGLSNVQATFRKVDDRWQLEGDVVMGAR